ncbi:chaperonin 10-like protein [Xylariales sp. PMI_506]|nr:chaperonin 10-like protein [Xylariales sp. PMI_506]
MTVFEIPKTCKAGVVVNEGSDFRVEIQEVSVPGPGPDEVLLKLNCTGLCMSDIHYMSNDCEIPLMSVAGVRCPGHEGAGIVVKVGENVKDWQLGDRAGIKPIWNTCGTCENCTDGKENYCQNLLNSGLHVNGTYQQYVVSPARYTTRIPDGVPDIVAGPIMCSATTMLTSLEQSQLKAGQWAVFIGGGGGVGIQGVQLAKAMGLKPIVVDTSAAKKELSLSMGAEAYIDFREVENVADEVKKIAGGVGAHGVFVVAPQGYKDAISYLGNRVGGKIMCIGIPPTNTVTIGADPLIYNAMNMHIMGSMTGTRETTDAALDYAKRGLLKQICEVRPLSQLPESVEQLRRGEIPGRIVIDFNQE